jgi:hypothetical protein
MTSRKLFVIMVVMPFLTALTLGGAAAWLSGDVRMIGLFGLVAAIVGGGLMGYFEWRVRLRRRMLEDVTSGRRAA